MNILLTFIKAYRIDSCLYQSHGVNVMVLNSLILIIQVKIDLLTPPSMLHDFHDTNSITFFHKFVHAFPKCAWVIELSQYFSSFLSVSFCFYDLLLLDIHCVQVVLDIGNSTIVNFLLLTTSYSYVLLSYDCGRNMSFLFMRVRVIQ